VITMSSLGVIGKLGNQMFQYAALLGISERLGLELKIPPLAQIDLARLCPISAEVITTSELRALRHRFEERKVGYHEDWRSIPDGCDVFGYFQSPRYFPDDDVVRRELAFVPDVLGPATARLDALRAAEPGRPIVGVTVRRADYLINPEFVVLSDTDYYPQVFDHFAPLSPRFLMSSDDPAWCRATFPGHEFAFMDELTDHQQLAALTLCDHLGIANSSYAWWAAWLNRTPGRTVVAASRWFTDGGEYPDHERDPLPDGWIEIKI
jgi:hypothetical protein